jgi:hypothetical protein
VWSVGDGGPTSELCSESETVLCQQEIPQMQRQQSEFAISFLVWCVCTALNVDYQNILLMALWKPSLRGQLLPRWGQTVYLKTQQNHLLGLVRQRVGFFVLWREQQRTWLTTGSFWNKVGCCYCVNKASRLMVGPLQLPTDARNLRIPSTSLLLYCSSTPLPTEYLKWAAATSCRHTSRCYTATTC